MAKSSTTLRRPARTATPEELAEENRRSEEARAATPLELRAAIDAVLGLGRIEERLLNQGWVPTTPAEVAAVLEEHAASLESAHEEIDAQERRLALLEVIAEGNARIAELVTELTALFVPSAATHPNHPRQGRNLSNTKLSPFRPAPGASG